MERHATQYPVNLDPRTLLCWALLAAVMVMSTISLHALAVLLAILVILIRTRETLLYLWRWLRWVLPILVFFGLVTGWAFGLPAGVLAGGKLLGITLVGHLFFLSIEPEEMANALVKAGLPFNIAFVVSAGMQFVTVLGRKSREVLEAQQTRGIPISAGWRVIRRFPTFFIPLLIQSFQLAEELAEAMEVRGFGRTGRSFYTEYRLVRKDWIALAGGVMVTGLWIWKGRMWTL